VREGKAIEIPCRFLADLIDDEKRGGQELGWLQVSDVFASRTLGQLTKAIEL